MKSQLHPLDRRCVRTWQSFSSFHLCYWCFIRCFSGLRKELCSSGGMFRLRARETTGRSVNRKKHQNWKSCNTFSRMIRDGRFRLNFACGQNITNDPEKQPQQVLQFQSREHNSSSRLYLHDDACLRSWSVIALVWIWAWVWRFLNVSLAYLKRWNFIAKTWRLVVLMKYSWLSYTFIYAIMRNISIMYQYFKGHRSAIYLFDC